MRAPVALAVVILAATTLSACGSSDGGSASGGSGDKDSYCSDLKKDAKYFSSLDSGDGTQIEEAINRFHELAGEAPDEVSSDWNTIDGAFTKLEQELKSAGITVKQFGEIQSSGKLPAGVDPSKLQGIVKNLQSLTGEKFNNAGTAIEKHAKSECKVDLSAS